MKKLLLALALIASCIAGAHAQRTEITLGYGGFTQMDATDCRDGWRGVNNAWGAVTAGVNYRLTNKLWVGPSYTFSSTHTKGHPHSAIAYHVLLAYGRYDYYRNSIFTLYGHLGLGVIISYLQPWGGDSYNCSYFGVQVSPIGAMARVSRNVSLYGEVGYGVQGVLQVGVRVAL